jgi:hypothetical protein
VAAETAVLTVVAWVDSAVSDLATAGSFLSFCICVTVGVLNRDRAPTESVLCLLHVTWHDVTSCDVACRDVA